jgi:DDE superfamily endonuclease
MKKSVLRLLTHQPYTPHRLYARPRRWPTQPPFLSATGSPTAWRSRRPCVSGSPFPHAARGGNVQVIAAPDGWPLWTSGVRPGREHDTTALRAHAQALPLLAAWSDEAHAALADLGYEGERAAPTIPVKHPSGRRLTADQRTRQTCCTPRSARRPNAATPCSRPPSRHCARSPSAPGASAPSPPPPSSCFTTCTTGPHDQPSCRPVTGNGSLIRASADGGVTGIKDRCRRETCGSRR